MRKEDVKNKAAVGVRRVCWAYDQRPEHTQQLVSVHIKHIRFTIRLFVSGKRSDFEL